MKLFSFGSKKKSEESTPVKPDDKSGSEPALGGNGDSGLSKSTEDLLRSIQQISSALEESESPAPPAPVEFKPTPSPSIKESMEKSKDRSLFKALLTGLYDAVIIVDARGVVVGSNKRAEQFFGYTEADLWNMPCEKLFAAFNARVLSKIKTHAESGRFTMVNATCARKDATTFPAEIAISRINLLHDGDLIFSIRNLERREKAKERHEMEIDALNCAGAGIAVCDSDGKIELANPAFVKLLRFTESKDVVNRFIGDFCTSYEAANALMKSPSANGTWLGRLELRTSDDKTLEVLVTAALSTRKKESPEVVLTLTPLPKMAATV